MPGHRGRKLRHLSDHRQIGRHESHPVAHLEQGRPRPCHVEEPRIRPPHEVPAPGAGKRIHPRLPAADADRAGRNQPPRSGPSRCREIHRQPGQIPEAGQESDRLDEIVRLRVAGDQSLRRDPVPATHLVEIRSVVRDRDLVRRSCAAGRSPSRGDKSRDTVSKPVEVVDGERVVGHRYPPRRGHHFGHGRHPRRVHCLCRGPHTAEGLGGCAPLDSDINRRISDRFSGSNIVWHGPESTPPTGRRGSLPGRHPDCG